MKYELGIVRANAFMYAVGLVKSVFATWLYCKKHNIQTSEWFGVYEEVTEHVIAQFGNMPNAKSRATTFVINMNKLEKQNDKLNKRF